MKSKSRKLFKTVDTMSLQLPAHWVQALHWLATFQLKPTYIAESAGTHLKTLLDLDS